MASPTAGRAPRAPRKYDDAERTRVTPEWLDWYAQQQELASTEGWEDLAAAGYEPSMYFPDMDGKAIPEEGAWILVVEEPYTELRARFRVPLLSMWRARPHTLNSGGVSTHGITVHPKQAVIATPAGDLHLWAHEYVVATSPMQLASDPDATLHSLGGQPVLDEDELFYLMSRGISRHDAVMLLFDRVQSLDFVYVTFPDEVTEALAGAGRSLSRHIALNPRTATEEHTP